MAKAHPDHPKAESAPKSKGFLVLLGLFGALAVAGGVAVPFFVPLGKHGGDSGEAKHAPTGKRAYVTFGEVVVNLNEERLTRYMRVKLLLVVDTAFEKQLTDLVLKNKPLLKNWLIGFLSDKSLQDVSGAAGVNKLRREVWREFNSELFPDGSEKIQDVFFEEFVIQ